MGIDIHTPTTGSRNSANNSTNGSSISPELQALMKRKVNIESELDELISVLDTHKVDMNTLLITHDEFPRSDIDVAQIRSTRTQIIRLRNDLKSVLSEIERQLHAHYSRMSAIAATTVENEISNDGETTTTVTVVQEDEVLVDAPVHIGFALVDEVVAESPASRAGLTVGDTIVEFGHLHVGNNERLKRLANVVQMNENKKINVLVLRDTQPVDLELIPSRNWGGRGLLGCHIVPL